MPKNLHPQEASKLIKDTGGGGGKNICSKFHQLSLPSTNYLQYANSLSDKVSSSYNEVWRKKKNRPEGGRSVRRTSLNRTLISITKRGENSSGNYEGRRDTVVAVCRGEIKKIKTSLAFWQLVSGNPSCRLHFFFFSFRMREETLLICFHWINPLIRIHLKAIFTSDIRSR